MVTAITSGALLGVKAYLVRVEVDISAGLPGFALIGSLSSETREARERVQVALKNIGLELPPKKITVNLSPADRRKEGTAFDLPIAVGLLQAMGYIDDGCLENTLFLGELGLGGEVKPVKGVLPMIQEAAKQGIRQAVVPWGNVMEGAVIPGIEMRGIQGIGQLLRFFQKKENLSACTVDVRQLLEEGSRKKEADFAEVIGQEGARRAAEIAAAGFHNLLLTGPPGAGKSMIARRIPGILPPLTLEESLEVTSVYSVAGLLEEGQALVAARPFQNPHHTITQAALTGGGALARPGMITLAHRGVLFLDELPEFNGSILDSLRQPIEERQIRIARTYGNISYPADFMLVGAMNPCPCGYYPDRNKCLCTENQVKRYLGKVSGPIWDRMDLCVEVLPVKPEMLGKKAVGESSHSIRQRVTEARKIQERRFRETGYHFNADIQAADVERFCSLGKEPREFMKQAYESFELSTRGYHRILRVARTIADLEGAEQIGKSHLAEAVCFRTADGNYWK